MSSALAKLVYFWATPHQRTADPERCFHDSSAKDDALSSLIDGSSRAVGCEASTNFVSGNMGRAAACGCRRRRRIVFCCTPQRAALWPASAQSICAPDELFATPSPYCQRPDLQALPQTAAALPARPAPHDRGARHCAL